MRVGVLGPLVVMRGGAEVGPLPPGERTVLGLLALTAGAWVRRESLIDVLWGEGSPASAVGILQTYVSRLRSRLGPEVLVRDGGSYRLRVSEDQLDLLAFRCAVAGARKATRPEDACQAYAEALALWRGDPLADVDLLRGHPAVTALTAERTDAVLAYADAAFTAGRQDEVLPRLRRLTVDDALNEKVHARLMLALAQTGRQAEALREFEALRQRLDEQLGVLPGPELRAAHEQVLRQDVPIRSAPSVCQLPAALADFTGRAADCADLIAAISPDEDQPGVPVVAISGQPGVGKTTLALFAAHQVRARFPDGQLWVPLAGASARPREPAEVLGELLRALGMPGSAIPDEISERAVCYRSRLAGRRMLVVADDAASAAQVRPLLPGTAGCALVVTSRARLEGLDGAHLMPLDVLTADDAAGLLAKIVGTDRVSAALDDAEELVRACGALPLAVRIAAAKLAARPSWPVSAMVRRLTGSHRRLGELEAGDLSVRASIASSYESLPAVPCRAFRLLALLGPADFAGWVVNAVAGGDDAVDVAGELVSRSLLTPLGVDATGEPRYRLHDLLRDYASEQLALEPAGDADSALGRALEGWLQLASLADSLLPPEPYFPPADPVPANDVVPAAEAARLTADPIAWFTAERGNLLAAVELACGSGRVELAYQLARRQCRSQYLQDRQDDTERMWRLITGEAATDVYAQLRIAASLVERGRSAEAILVLDRCAVAAETIEEETLALVLYWRAACAWDVDDFDRARADASRGVCVARRAGSLHAEFMNLRMLANVLAWFGEGERALAAGESALAITVDLAVAPYELVALYNLAYACTLVGRYERAICLYTRTIELSRGLGDPRLEAQAYAMLGDAYSGLGQHGLAVHSLLRALPILQDHQAHRHAALCLLKLGFAHESLQCYPEAISYLTESVLIFHQLSLPHKAEEAEQTLDRCRVAAGATVS
jgi:DNA-binding SARP family transcriptional activator/tetratricopeptide (TPR) repeat protein